jgi:hypothetical protein
MTIKSINWTYTVPIDNLWAMDTSERPQDLETAAQPSHHECECPEPCNCDHENE